MSEWKETGSDGVKELEYQEIGLIHEDMDYARRFFLIRFPWAEEQPDEDAVREAVRRNFQAWSCQCSHDCCGCSLGYTGNLVGRLPHSDDQWVVSQLIGRNV